MLTVVGRVKGFMRSVVQRVGCACEHGRVRARACPPGLRVGCFWRRPCGWRALSRQQAWSSCVCSAGVVGVTLPKSANQWGGARSGRVWGARAVRVTRCGAFFWRCVVACRAQRSPLSSREGFVRVDGRASRTVCVRVCRWPLARGLKHKTP